MDYESQLRLERDAAVVAAALEAAGGHLVHRVADPDDPNAPVDRPGLYWAVIQPSAPGTDPFIARVFWSVYPDRPPSLLFATEVGGPTNFASAWPAANGYRAPNDICKPFTAEGQALHGEWAAGVTAWRSDGNPFLYVTENVIDDINRVRGARAS
ncbi:hypothetical protein DJ010_12720 [Nocardioides silvaticus]|uniref:Uncharacterized protein n=1 Tax=Nocardioides silvaticus TaxID=2201891 RepID=A0A316TJY9_9ACTN|nr:hypothetical protein [Nocardioides silvaticus]PWN02572.1 hypothetical protein DJ010_12720 [Nocardioides silvaticus]